MVELLTREREAENKTWPCLDGSLRPWSLWDLLNAYASAFHLIAQYFDRFGEDCDAIGGGDVPAELRSRLLDKQTGVPNARDWVGMLGMTRSMELAYEIEMRITHNATIKASDANAWLDMLTVVMERELGDRFLYFVPDDLPSLCFNPRDAWGAAPNKFTKAATDIDEASYCLGLGRPTACVMHLMRVLQTGLVSLAAAVNSTIKNPRDENWLRVIENIDARIKEMQPGANHPNPPSSADRQFYASAALQFTHFKDAFRNQVTHTNVIYTKEDGRSIYNHVRDFMAHLATRLAE